MVALSNAVSALDEFLLVSRPPRCASAESRVGAAAESSTSVDEDTSTVQPSARLVYRLGAATQQSNRGGPCMPHLFLLSTVHQALVGDVSEPVPLSEDGSVRAEHVARLSAVRATLASTLDCLAPHLSSTMGAACPDGSTHLPEKEDAGAAVQAQQALEDWIVGPLTGLVQAWLASSMSTLCDRELSDELVQMALSAAETCVNLMVELPATGAAQALRDFLQGSSCSRAVFCAAGAAPFLLSCSNERDGSLVASHLLTSCSTPALLRDALALGIAPSVLQFAQLAPGQGRDEELLVGLQWCAPAWSARTLMPQCSGDPTLDARSQT